ncbi:AsmA family protein [Algoriphagus machipongonensis]|uniref:DUF748 domain-containing protein n=1 Tax=Algoriphagus machipongonensis TaxID=388413 RepID=A3I0X8_9BACT|nr:hypothetical protein [Algoriphagus machipongonensis]EAZ80124.1 hypothetical protein ALPR1_15884 [Algoriphagus machipongonensis]
MKKFGLIVLILLITGVAGTFFLENWLTHRIPETVNSNPDRDYDLVFDDIDIQLFKRRVVIRDILMNPMNDSLSSKVNGSLRSIRMSGVNLWKLIFEDKLEIDELKIIEPAFRLIQREKGSHGQNSSQAFQLIFQDIISRGEIKHFVLEKGTAEMFVESDSLFRFGHFTDLNIKADGLESDSIIIKQAVPFKLASLEASIKNVQIQIDSEQEFNVESIDYKSLNNEILFEGISLKFKEGIDAAVQNAAYQQDLIELDIQTVKLGHIDTESSIYGDWSVKAGLLTVDSLVLVDLRDKNKPRPDEPVKPMFEGMVEKIPFPLYLDTVSIRNSKIVYKEIKDGNSEPASLEFSSVSGDIYNMISKDSLQLDKTMEIHANAIFNEEAEVGMDVYVPFGNETFELNAFIKAFELPRINQTLIQMANIRVESGSVLGLNLSMKANQYSSQNSLAFDYQNLKIEVLDQNSTGNKKKGLISSVANLLTSKNNLPGSNSYQTATYQTKRNVYRSPFNLIWESIKEGVEEIVPSGLAKIFVGSD